jgi:hypothetical protein
LVYALKFSGLDVALIASPAFVFEVCLVIHPIHESSSHQGHELPDEIRGKHKHNPAFCLGFDGGES